MKCNNKRGPRCCDDRKRKRHNAGAQNLAEARRDLYILRGRRALLMYLLCAGEGTADDVRDNVELPRGLSPRLFGAVPGELVRAGMIRFGGYERTCRPTAHSRPVTVWTLADRAAAERWLADHPDLPDPVVHDQGSNSQRLRFPVLHTNEPTPTASTAGAGLEV
jgi:hypothetical protein